MHRVLNTKVLVNAGVLLSVALLIVGFAAYVSSRPDPPGTNTKPYPRDYELPVTTPSYTAADLPKGVQKTAGEFILSAAGREDLAKAWKLTHPELRNQCGCTYKEWLTGNIPVQYYPTSAISTATLAIDLITPREVSMRVLLLPKKSAKVKPQVFDIGLKAQGTGASKRWLVNYWNAKVSIPVPALAP
jgi:hypothetical protein